MEQINNNSYTRLLSNLKNAPDDERILKALSSWKQEISTEKLELRLDRLSVLQVYTREAGFPAHIRMTIFRFIHSARQEWKPAA